MLISHATGYPCHVFDKVHYEFPRFASCHFAARGEHLRFVFGQSLISYGFQSANDFVEGYIVG
jgi:hypothetical protein